MRGKRRSPEERVSSVAGPLPPCRVCGETAAGFHYGVNTCEACKGFFRRSLLRSGEYECLGSGNCFIGLNRRKCCPKCRYLKCLSVGMSKEAIKTGRYTYMKRTQDILEVKTLKQTKEKSSSNFVTDIDCFSHNILPECSINQRSVQEDVKDGNIYIRNSLCSTYSSNESSPDIISECRSPSDSSPAKIEFVPDSSTNALSQNNILKVNNIKGLNNTGSHITKPHNPLSPSIKCDKKVACAQYPRLLSSVSLEENSLELESPKIPHPHNPSSLTEELSSVTGCSQHSVEAYPLQQKSLQAEFNTWHEYSETELDEFIMTIVSGHRAHVEDANNISDECLQEMFRECKERCSLQTEIFGHLGVIEKDEHDQIYTSTGLDVDGRLDNLSYAAQKMDVYVRQMISFIKLIPGFRSLSLSDQTALVKASMCDLFVLGAFRGYNRDDLIVVEASRSYCRHQMMMFNTEEDMDTIFIISQKLQNLHLTYEIIVILKALCVFFSDRATLEKPQAVEQLQYKIVQCLMLLLQRHYQCKNGLMLARILSILSQIRNHVEECHKFIVANLLSGSYGERFYNVPIILEFLSSYLNK